MYYDFHSRQRILDSMYEALYKSVNFEHFKRFLSHFKITYNHILENWYKSRFNEMNKFRSLNIYCDYKSFQNYYEENIMLTPDCQQCDVVIGNYWKTIGGENNV